MNGFQLARSWRILILGPGAELAGEARSVMSREAPAAQLYEVRTYPEPAALSRMLASQNLSVCLLDAASSPDLAIALLREIQAVAPQLAVIAMLDADDPDLILRCLRQGAAEFLSRPLQSSQIDQVFQRLAASRPELGSMASCARLIAVCPVKGSCGASTIGLNLAFQRKRLGAKKVLLADLDPLTGTISFMLSSRPSYSFLDAIGRGAALDVDVWKSLVQTIDGVDVLYAPESVSEGLYSLADPHPLFDFARHHYDLILADLASVYGEWNLNVVRRSDEVLLVTSSDACGIRSSQRALRHLEKHRVPADKIKIVVNRFSREFGVGTDVVRTALQNEIFATLPADYESVHRALVEGKSIPQNTPFGKGLSSLAEALAAPGTREESASTPKAAPKSGALSGLLGILGRKTTS